MKKKFTKFLILGIMAISAVVYSKGHKNYNIRLTREKAEQLALSHAKVSKNEAVVKKIKLDRENGRIVYEIEFYDKNNRKYEYDVDANTGKIISYRQKMGKSSDSNDSINNSADYIGEAKARAIALSKVRGAKESNIVKIQLDREDGKMVYEGKIIYNNTEYEFDIDAMTGNIISWEEEKH